MATIHALAKDLGVLVNTVKEDAGLPRGISSATELSPDQELQVRQAVRDRASAGIPAVEPTEEVEEQAAQAPVIEKKAEELETPQPEPEPEPLPELVNEEPELPAENHRSNTWAWATLAIIFVAVLLLMGYLLGKGLNPPVNATPTTMVVEYTPTPTSAAVTQAATQTATQAPTLAATQPAATQAATEAAPVTDGKTLAESILGKTLPWPVPAYVADQPGFPQICAGLCWDTSKLDQGVMMYYGPWNGEEDITQSDATFGNGNPGPLELMRSGKITKVVFYVGKEAQLEVCAVGSLDGTPLTQILGVKSGECGKRVAIKAGWHVIQDNANTPIAGFGIRFTASGWAGMSENQIVEYTKYWTISGDTATWIGPEGVEIMMTPSMVQMMQDFGILKNVVFTTKTPGKVLFCNGNVTGSATLSSPDGACHLYDVPVGTFSYNGEARLSAGISWQPAVK